MKFVKKKKSKVVIILILLLLIGVGYAILNYDLSILGIGNLGQNSWNIYFDNVQEVGGIELTFDDIPPTIDSTDKTSVSYAISFELPGDYYEFTVDVVNSGTLDGMVDSIFYRVDDQDVNALPNYLECDIRYADGGEIKKDHLLKVGERITLIVKAGYKKDITVADLPKEDTIVEVTFGVKYVQADEHAVKRAPIIRCNYEEELVDNVVYTNGQYQYTYSLSTDGWKVVLADKNSTDPVTTELCTYINEKPVNDMHDMFSFSKTPSIDTSTFNTSNVTNMSFMFAHANDLEELDVSIFDTSNVTNMSYMFNSASSLKNIDVSRFDTSNVTNMIYMFENASSLEKIDLSSFDVSKAYFNNQIEGLLMDTGSLESANLDGWDLSSANIAEDINNVRGKSIFLRSSVKNISCKNWKLPEDFDNWINRWQNINVESIDVTGWDLSLTNNLSYLFANTQGKLKEIIGLDTWDTSHVTNMERMFHSVGMEELDLSTFNTSNVTNATYMIVYCPNLKKVNLSNWNIRKMGVRGLNVIFQGSPVETLILKNWVLPESASHLFASNVLATTDVNIDKTIDVTGWDLSQTNNLTSVFGNRGDIKEIKGLNTWDTSNITNMSLMFYVSTGLQSIDLSSFDISNVNNISNMFDGATNLEKLDFSNADFSSITSFYDVFKSVPETIKIYVKDEAARDWIITNGGNTNLTIDNVLIK